jgi:DNA topoisomerase-2
LRRQIGDREMEVDALIKLSKEDIWKKDLDDFLDEWKFQLEDEERRMKKVASLGRRASTKLKTSAKSATARKRKALGDDPDDGDFGVRKPKKSTTVNHVKPKSGLLDYLGKASPKDKQPAKNPRAKDKGVDGAGDLDELDDEVVATKSKAVSKPEATKSKDDSSVDEEVVPMATSRKPRVRKPIKYGNSSESDSENGDDLLGDVSKMVKGISGSGDSILEPRTLFSERSRPGSSTGLKATSKPSKAATDFDPDETDYSKLVPQQSPRRSLLVKSKDPNPVNNDGGDASAGANSDEDDESDDVIPPPAAKKQAASKSKQAAAKHAKSSSTGLAARGKGKKETAKAAPAPAKKLQPSPAAKAYASKQAKASKKKISDDLSDDDIDAMANDILDSPSVGLGDPDSDASPVRPAKKATAPASTRPSRRAAATSKKPAYVIEDISDDEDDFDGDEPSDDDLSDFE